MAGGKGLSTQEIAVKIKLSARAARTRLLALVARGLVAEVGTSPQDPKRKYFLADRGVRACNDLQNGNSSRSERNLFGRKFGSRNENWIKEIKHEQITLS